VLPASKGNPAPIKPERLQGWWKAAVARPGAAADGLRLMLLTGCRPGEIFGSVYAPGLLVQDVDLAGARMVLPDTKNRTDHTVLLSKQALAILAANCKDKKPGAKVFDLVDAGKALDAINAAAGTEGTSAHKLRHTFASVAAGTVNAFALKTMMNHSAGGDVTAVHYVHQSEAQLRAAWQAVADTICG
jgi:integrase